MDFVTDNQIIEAATVDDFNLFCKITGFNLSIEEIKDIIKQSKCEPPINVSNRCDNYPIKKVLKIYSNQRNTMKYVILNDGVHGFISKKAIDRNWVAQGNDVSYITQLIAEGKYVVTSERYDSRKEILKVLDWNRQETEEAVKLINEAYNELNHPIYPTFNIKNPPNLEIESLKDWVNRIKKYINKCDEEALEKKRRRDEQYKSIKHNGTLYQIPIGNKTLEVNINYPSFKETLIDIFENTNTPMNRIIESLVSKYRNFSVKYTGKSKVNVTIEIIKKNNGTESRIYRINNVITKATEVADQIINFFNGTEQSPIKLKERKINMQKVKTYDQEGIKGVIKDIEGRTPIYLAFTKEKGKWYLNCMNKMSPLPGGMQTIDKIRNILHGRTQNFSDKNSTIALLKVLQEFLTSSYALEVINEAKTSGRMAYKLSTPYERENWPSVNSWETLTV